MLVIRAAAAALCLGAAVPASAGCGCSTSGAGIDTQLAYQGGVVYDDDLVPGRAPNQPYLVDEQGGGGAFYGDGDPGYGSGYAAPVYRERFVRPAYDDIFDDDDFGDETRRARVRVDSPNLIGRGGRAIRR